MSTGWFMFHAIILGGAFLSLLIMGFILFRIGPIDDVRPFR